MTQVMNLPFIPSSDSSLIKRKLKLRNVITYDYKHLPLGYNYEKDCCEHVLISGRSIPNEFIYHLCILQRD